MQYLQSCLCAGRRLAVQHETKVRFLFAGALNTAVGLATYPALYFLLASLELHYMAILLISQVLCVAFSYLTNKYLVFRTTGNVLREFAKFVTFHLGYLLLNLVSLPLLVEFLHMNPVVGQTLFAVLVIVSSYFWHDNITFSRVERK